MKWRSRGLIILALFIIMIIAIGTGLLFWHNGNSNQQTNATTSSNIAARTQAATPTPLTVTPQAATPTSSSFTSSTWKGIAHGYGSSFSLLLTFSLTGNTFTGTETMAGSSKYAILNGKVNSTGNSLVITYNTNEVGNQLADCTATIQGSTMTGSCAWQGSQLDSYTVYK